MPNNTPSWNRLKKDPDFYKNNELNTSPVGRTYIPKGTKIESVNKNNPNKYKVPPTTKSSVSGLSMDEYKEMYHPEDEGYIHVYEEDETSDCFIPPTKSKPLTYLQEQALIAGDWDS